MHLSRGGCKILYTSRQKLSCIQKVCEVRSKSMDIARFIENSDFRVLYINLKFHALAAVISVEILRFRNLTHNSWLLQTTQSVLYPRARLDAPLLTYILTSVNRFHGKFRDFHIWKQETTTIYCAIGKNHSILLFQSSQSLDQQWVQRTKQPPCFLVVIDVFAGQMLSWRSLDQLLTSGSWIAY